MRAISHLAGLAAALLFAGVGVRVGAAPGLVLESDSRFIIDYWDVDAGLPQNSVTAVLQGRDGYLWFGTLNGLVRFDGVRFTVFDESNTSGLASSRIVSLFEDRQGKLWIGTQTGGIALLRDGQITPTGIGQHAAESRLVAGCEDASGTVWLYTADGQLWNHRNDRLTPFLFGADTPSNCRALIAEPSGPVWVGTDRRLASISADPASGQLEPRLEQEVSVGRLDYLLASAGGGYWRLADGRVTKCRGGAVELDLGPYPWSLVPVAAACVDRQGNRVVGTLGGGVFWFEPEGRVARLSTERGLSHNFILSLEVDREGNLWVGTDGGGLNRVKRQVFEDLEGARSQVVQTVAEDRDGGLWFGSNGGGVSCWDRGNLRRYGFAQGLMSSSVWSVFVDRDEQVWAGTRGAGLFRLVNGRFQPAAGPGVLPREVWAMHQDREGRLWLGTPSGLCCRTGSEWKVFTTRDGLSSDVVQAIAEDAEGGLWIGTVGGGLNRFHGGRFTVFGRAEGVPSENISSLLMDEEGVLWVGTFGSGLACGRGGEWSRFTASDGLLSNSIGYLIEDDQGHLWIGSNAGLMRVRKEALNDFAARRASVIPCRGYGRLDGLPTRECTMGSQPGAHRARDGKLWFPTIKGLAGVYPDRLAPNLQAPPVRIENVLIDGQPQETNALRAGLMESVVIPPGRQRIEIQYTSLLLGAPDRSRFRYRLDGFEEDWTEAGTTRLARYSRLPPGEYRFEVTACNEDGEWNPAGQTLRVIVATPFWRAWWFMTPAVLGALAMGVGILHYVSTQRLQRQLERLRQAQALEKERSRIAQDIHDQLGASLTQVSLLGELVESDKDAPAEVEAHARQITQTARETTRTLDEIVWAVNPSNDTLDGLITYLCKYAQEYVAVAGLQYRLDVPGTLPGAVIPPEVRHNVYLAFKEAVTNVVRHAKATAVWVRLRLEPGVFRIEVEDNGCGMAGLDERQALTRNGLRNMRRRMEGIGGAYVAGPGAEGGTRVCLTAPLGSSTLRGQ